MKIKLLITLLLISVNAWAITPAPTPLPPETPNIDVEVIPNEYPFLNEPTTCPENWFLFAGSCRPFQFSSHLEAEQHYYHSSWGILIWGNIIKEKIPSFEPFPIVFYSASSLFCYYRNGFEIYPNSNVCSKFLTHEEAEVNYFASSLTNFQYWNLLIEVQNQNKDTTSCNDLGWGGETDNQARWKPDSETTGRLVVLLPNQHCSNQFGAQGAFGSTFFPLISNMRIEDKFGNVMDRGRLRHCGQHNNGRLHWDFAGTEGLPSPVFVRYEFQGAERCRKVDNPRSNLGR